MPSLSASLTCDSAETCAASPQERDKVKSLVQLSKGHKTVKEQAHETHEENHAEVASPRAPLAARALATQQAPVAELAAKQKRQTPGDWRSIEPVAPFIQPTTDFAAVAPAEPEAQIAPAAEPAFANAEPVAPEAPLAPEAPVAPEAREAPVAPEVTTMAFASQESAASYGANALVEPALPIDPAPVAAAMPMSAAPVAEAPVAAATPMFAPAAEASMESMYVNFFNGSGKLPSNSDAKAITFITVYDPMFENHLGTSSLWVFRAALPHQWMLLNNSASSNVGISELYAKASKFAANDLMVFLHPDVYLPHEFYLQFMQKLHDIEQIDPNWGVLGTAGIENQTQYENGVIASSITDTTQTFNTGVDSLPLETLDEHLLVLRRNGPTFDPELPGVDLYGMDICLSARKWGQKAYLLNVPVVHKVFDLDGSPYQASVFASKVMSDDYQQRVDVSVQYFQKKWCPQGYLPIQGTMFHVECNSWYTR